MRLGFAVKVLGAKGNTSRIKEEDSLPSNDARRWQSGPHVRQSIVYARDIFQYLHKTNIRMYRMSSDFAPYLTHPEMPQFHGQLDEAAEELAELGALARTYDIRLSLHPSQYILLNAQDETVATKSINDLNAQSALLDALGCGPEGVVVTHIGGVYDDRTASRERFIRRWHDLPDATKKRLVVENDDVSYSVTDALAVHAETGCPVVFDNLHHFCFNPERLPMRDALAAALATWPQEVTPKIHYSSPSTSFDPETKQEKGESGRERTVQYLRVPPTKAHADFISPLEFAQFWEGMGIDNLRPFDVMLEAKAKDIALLRLRQEIQKRGIAPGAVIQ